MEASKWWVPWFSNPCLAEFIAETYRHFFSILWWRRYFKSYHLKRQAQVCTFAAAIDKLLKACLWIMVSLKCLRVFVIGCNRQGGHNVFRLKYWTSKTLMQLKISIDNLSAQIWRLNNIWRVRNPQSLNDLHLPVYCDGTRYGDVFSTCYKGNCYHQEYLTPGESTKITDSLLVPW